MAELTEREILDCLKENLRLAAEEADNLADGKRGKAYMNFRRELKLVYGCCRQMSGWREDTRWSPFGVKLMALQERVGGWLRSKDPAWRFRSVAEILRMALAHALELERKKVGKLGIILPKVKAAPTRTQGRQILVPDGYKAIRDRSVH